MRHFVLTEPATVDGQIRPEGYVFALPDGKEPPVRHVQAAAGACEAVQLTRAATPEEVAAAEEAARTSPPASPESAAEQPEPPGQRYRLLATAEVDGAMREPGYIFRLQDGERGPERAVYEGEDRIDWDAGGERLRGKVKVEPLYEAVPDEPASDTTLTALGVE